MKGFPLRLGVHVSIQGGLEKAVTRARDLGCSAMQIFSRNPRGWAGSALDRVSIAAFRRAAAQADIRPIVIHTPYLINLATPDGSLYEKSAGILSEDLDRAEKLGATAVVTHLGSGKEGDPSSGRRRVIEALRRVMERDSPVLLLLENSAGGGNTVGSSLEELAEILEGAGKDPRLGFCFDTCHGFAAGYDFRTGEQSRALVGLIRQTIGPDRLGLVHLNDSQGRLGSRRDRHQHIGEGEIGGEGFRSLLGQGLFRQIPLILETPRKRPGDDPKNLARVRELFRRAGKPGRTRLSRVAGENSRRKNGG